MTNHTITNPAGPDHIGAGHTGAGPTNAGHDDAGPADAGHDSAGAAPTRVVPDLPADPRRIFAAALERAVAVVRGIRAEQLGGVTPCDELDVCGLIVHLVEVTQRIAALGDGRDPMALPGAPVGLDLAGLRAEVERGAAAAIAAFAPADRLDAMRSLPWVTMPGRAHLASYTNELTVHAWDLAVATGQAVVWDDEVVALADRAIRAAFPPVRSTVFAALSVDQPELFAAGHPWRDAVDPGDAGAPIDRLVAYNGRDPRWQPAPAGRGVSAG